jgi:hypothetical protein
MCCTGCKPPMTRCGSCCAPGTAARGANGAPADGSAGRQVSKVHKTRAGRRPGAPDADFAVVEAVFSAEETAALTFAIVAINGWNRLAVGLGSDVTSLDGLDLPADAGAPQPG